MVAAAVGHVNIGFPPGGSVRVHCSHSAATSY
jgi:hypothetical protein